MSSNSRKTQTWIVVTLGERMPPHRVVNELSSDPVIQAKQVPQILLHKPSSGATVAAARPKAGITIPSHDLLSTPVPVRCARCGNRMRRRPQLKPGRPIDRDVRTSNAPA